MGFKKISSLISRRSLGSFLLSGHRKKMPLHEQCTDHTNEKKFVWRSLIYKTFFKLRLSLAFFSQ